MKFINYLLLFSTILISIFMFFVSAKQIEIVPNKNASYISEQIMILEKSNDMKQIKQIAENSITNENILNKQSSDFAAKMNTWIILSLVIQCIMGILFYLQFRKSQRLNHKKSQVI